MPLRSRYPHLISLQFVLAMFGFVLITSVFQSACGGGGGGSSANATPASTITAVVSVSCNPTSVQVGQTSQCTATVTGTGSYSSSVTWSASAGTINSSGLFTAPATAGTATVTATSVQDTTKNGTATVTVTAPSGTITSVSVSCNPTSVQTGGTSQCTATVTGTGSYSSAVNWSVNAIQGGNSTVGTISSSGLYTAPSSVPSTNPVTVTATSVANTAMSASASVTITPPATATLTGAVAISPISGALVTAYSLNPDGTVGASLGTTSSKADGSYSLTMSPAPAGPFVVYAVGGSYTDEVTGASVNLLGSPELSAVAPASATQVAITALTNMASARATTLAAAGMSLETAVSTSNIGVEQQYQLLDTLGTLPVAANNATAIETSVIEQRNYGLVLAGIMQEAQTLNVRAIDLANALAADATDGTLDGMDPGTPIVIPTIDGGSVTMPAGAGTSLLQAAMNQFIASPNNATGVTAENILSTAIPIGPNNSVGFYPYVPKLPAWVSGQPGQVTLGVAPAPGSVGGTLPFHCKLAPGSPPPASWIGLQTDDVCVLSGTAPALPAGTTEEILPGPFTLQFTDSSVPVANQIEFSYWITVVEVAPKWLSPSPYGTCPAGSVGISADTGACPFATASDVTGGTPPYFFLDDPEGLLPPLGVFVNSDGSVSVSSSVAPGTYTFDLCVVDSAGFEGCTGDNPATLTVTQGFTLTVSTSGTGSGTITSTPAGIACPGTCSASFASGTAVTLTATPTSGSAFTGWSGACSGTGACSVTMNSNQSVTATFNLGLQIGVNGGNVLYGGASVSCTNSGGLSDNCTGSVLLNIGVGIMNGVVAVSMDQLLFDGGNSYAAGTVPGTVTISLSGVIFQGSCSAGTINTDIEVVDGYTSSTYKEIGSSESVPLAISCGPGT